MESNSAQSHDQDRFSQLTDDILLSILERVNMRTVIRTSILSTRWRHLPFALSHLNLDVDDFLCPNSTMVAKETLKSEAMAVLVKTMSSLLASPPESERECTIRRLNLSFCLLTDLMASVTNLYDISKLICNAIDSGIVKSVEFAITTEKDCLGYDSKVKLRNAKTLVQFFDMSPSLFSCLTKLSLYSARFSGPEMHQLLVSCEQLQHLILINCETSDGSLLKVDMPNSKLRLLEIIWCSFERVELLCLPKLVHLKCDTWTSPNAPLSFGLVPCLEELVLVCAATFDQLAFKLTDLLCNTANIQALTFDFQGEKIWITPEGKELHTSFKKLKKLFLHGIYVEFDLSWTMLLLEAAPSVNIFGVKVWDHICDEDRGIYSERTNGSWDAVKFDGTTPLLQLKRLEFGGFKAIKEHIYFLRAVMERAPNMKAVVLADRETCKECEALDTPIPRMTSLFPKNNDEKNIIADQLRVGSSRHVQIILQ